MILPKSSMCNPFSRASLEHSLTTNSHAYNGRCNPSQRRAAVVSNYEIQKTRKESRTSMSSPWACCFYRIYVPMTKLTNIRFVLNGLRHANTVLGQTVFNERDWKVVGEYVFDDQGGRHQAFYAPLRDTLVMGELIKTHERIQVEQSLKFSPGEAQRLWNRAGMVEVGQWRHGDEYGEWLHTRPYRRSGSFGAMISLSSSPNKHPEALPHVSLTRGTSRMRF